MITLVSSKCIIISVLVLYNGLFVKTAVESHKFVDWDEEDYNVTWKEKPPTKKQLDFKEIMRINKLYKPAIDRCLFKIHGGQKAERGDVPYQVALRRVSNHGRRWSTFCGGSVVTAKHVITAAHCVKRAPSITKHNIRVVASTDQKNVEFKGRTRHARIRELKAIQKIETWRSIKDFFCHNEYEKFPVFKNDAAIIELKKKIIFDAFVQPIPIESKLINTNHFYNCLISGYGRTDGDKISKVLRMACIPIIPFSTCFRIYLAITAEHHICSGQAGTHCGLGDSGGPLACNGMLVGLTSMGTTASPVKVFTLITTYARAKNKVLLTQCASFIFKVKYSVVTMTTALLYVCNKIIISL